MTSTDCVPASNLNLTPRQIMLSFAYLAYCGQAITNRDGVCSEILGLIKAAIPQIPPIASPTWEVVWGPAVFTMPGSLYQDNMMFVAQNQSDKTQFVVAVRGTNFVSDLDWLMEDLDIFQMMPWPAAANAMISESTSIDLQILLAMKDPFSVGTCLLHFLKSQTGPSQPINVCVTGHSLGGCAGGTLALYLKDNRGQWDKSGTSVVSCITFAAPTAGNAEFAAYSDQQFANNGTGKQFPGWAAGLGSDFDAVRCTLDVAPMAWTTYAVTVGDNYYPPLFTIYVPNGLDFTEAYHGELLSDYVLQPYVFPWLQNTMNVRNYQQVEVAQNANALTGIFNTSWPVQDDGYLSDYVTAFVNQAQFQHGSSYPSLLCVPQLNCKNIIVTGLTASKPLIDGYARYWRRSLYAARRMASA